VRGAGAALLGALALAACGNQQWAFDADAGSTGAAGACSRDSDCRLSTLHCDTVSGACVACIDDSQCTDPNLRICDSALNSCVQCGVDGDCAIGQECEPTTHHCVSSCADGGSCPASAPHCTGGYCLGCTTNGDCATSAAGNVCDTATGQCVACTSDAQCPSQLRRCDRTTDTCVACLTSADCHDNFCDPTTHTCKDT
jgi:hypothetical protein